MKKKQKVQANGKGSFIFKLYITGASPNSARAIVNLKNILENHLPGLYKLEIIDVHQLPQIAKTVDIIALPLLVRESPLPQRRMIGDLSNENLIVERLELKDS